MTSGKPLITCSSPKKNGEPCGQPPVFGSTVCKWHGGTSPFAKAMAQARIEATLVPLIGVVFDLALNSLDENVRLKAAFGLMDRGGLGTESKLEITANAGRVTEVMEFSREELEEHAQRLLANIQQLGAKDAEESQEELAEIREDEELQGALKKSRLDHLDRQIDNVKERLKK